MRIRCWGSRGSFPVSGAEFVRYGGDTACVEVESCKGDVVILDAGTGIRRFGDSFAAAGRGGAVHIIFSHAHLDHVMGFPYFPPLYDEKAALHIYGCPCASGSFEAALRGLMRAPYFPVDFDAVPARVAFHEVTDAGFAVGSLKFAPIRLNHPNGCRGYRIEEEGKAFVFMTDNELEYGKDGASAEYFESMCAKADLLIHDAEYTDEEYARHESWGHSKYADAARLAVAAKVKHLGMFHLNAHRTDAQMDEIVEDARKIIAKIGSSVECFGVAAGFEITI